MEAAVQEQKALIKASVTAIGLRDGKARQWHFAGP